MEGEFQKIVNMLRYFVDTRQYSVVDRLAYAVNPAVAKYALYDAVRQIRSAKDRAKEGKTDRGSVECCFYDKAEGEGCDVGFKVAIEGAPHCCVPCPAIPTEEELARVMEALERDVSSAAKLAALALSYREKRGEGR